MHLYCVRHTAVSIDSDICYGQSDVPLNHTYKADLQKIFQSLPLSTVEFSGIYSSPSIRCKKLAFDLHELINKERMESALLLDPIIDNRLMELNFGEWELRSWNDITGPKAEVWMNDWIHQRAGNGSGESLLDLIDRVRSFLDDLENMTCGDTEHILVSTHSGVIRALYILLNNTALEDYFIVKPVYGGLHVLHQ